MEPASCIGPASAGSTRSRTPVGFQRLACLRAEGAEQQVLLDRQPRERAAALRHQRDAEVDDLLGGAADQVVGLAIDLGEDAPVRGRMPITHFISVDLPLPLVPSTTVSPP
jgi:hypothetical protein